MGDRPALGIKNGAAHSREAHRAHGLFLEILRIGQGGGHLHVPQAGEQHGHAKEQHAAHGINAPVLFALGIYLSHGDCG